MVHENSSVIKKLITDEQLLSVARYVLDDDVYIHQSRINYKPAFHAVVKLQRIIIFNP